jgi:hypothetical protein
VILKTGGVRLSFWGTEEGEKREKKSIVLQERKTGDLNGKLPFALISVLGQTLWRNTGSNVRWKQAVLYNSRSFSDV